MSLRHWVNDGLLTIFFLVVGLEIKREFTVGHLASRRSAALPIAAAIGGMAVPALIYRADHPAGRLGEWLGHADGDGHRLRRGADRHDGRRVPVELRIFLTAAAIVDDIGAITVVAVFYSHDLHFEYLAAAAALIGALALLNSSHVYRVQPYVLRRHRAVGVRLCQRPARDAWRRACSLLFIPTRPPPNLQCLDEPGEQHPCRGGAPRRRSAAARPLAADARALDAIHDRMESPADRLLRHAGAALELHRAAAVRAGQRRRRVGDRCVRRTRVADGAIAAGLVIGKPLGLVGASVLAVKLGAAVKPAEYSWRQLAGAGAMAGIGFTMSLFIAGQALPNAGDFAAAKIAVFAASIISALIGVALLWGANNQTAAAEA